MFGKLTLDAIPYHEPIIMGTLRRRCARRLALLGRSPTSAKWTYLWTEWFTSVDHKQHRRDVLRASALVMLLRGFADAIMMRAQQAVAATTPPVICRRTTTTRSSPRTA